MDVRSADRAATSGGPTLPELVAALPPSLGGPRPPDHVLRDARSRAVTSLMRVNAKLLDAAPRDGGSTAPQDHEGLVELRRAWADIRCEWEEIRHRLDRLPTMDRIIGQPPGWDGDWEWFAIHTYSRWEPWAVTAAPRTVALLRGVTGLRQAAFSVLTPGTFLHPHRGVNTGVLRGLLGLVVDEPEQCGMLVGDRRMDLGPGVLRIFDDTQEHAAWNAGSTERVALLLEIERPARGLAGGVNRLCQRVYRHHGLVAHGIDRVDELMREAELPSSA